MHTQPLVLITTSSFATEWATEEGATGCIKNLMANTTISEMLCKAVVMLIGFQCSETPGLTGGIFEWGTDCSVILYIL